jgi:uncharacterized protein YdhG (YjbR/CyaY superfamily)
MNPPASIDEYVASFPAEVQDRLQSIRRTMHDAVPGASETIRYDIPTLQLGGKSVAHFGGWKQHIAMYPVPDLDDALAADVEPYRSGKGTLRFPHNRPVPLDLIARLVRLLVEQRHAS